MLDLAMLRAYHAEMSDADLLDLSAEGAGAYVPEAWTIIADEISTRNLEMRPPEIVVPEIDSHPESVRLERTSSDDLRFGVNTAYATAAYFALNLAAGLILHWSILFNLYLFTAAIFYVAAAVRMKRRQSVRAAALALAVAVALMLRQGYLTLTQRYWEAHFSYMAMYAVTAYLFAEALWATRSLRNDRAEAALALAATSVTPSL